MPRGTSWAIVEAVIAPSVAAMADAISGQRRRLVLPSAPPYERLSGVIFVGLLVAVIQLLGKPAALDPAVLVPVAVLAGTAIGGLWSGVLATAVGCAYLVLFYAQPGLAASTGGMARVVASLLASGALIGIATYLSDRSRSERDAAAAAARRSALVSDFAARLANDDPDQMPTALTNGVAELLRADLAVLTVLDPPSGRQFVRAARGGSSAVGVEVVSGVGITGQAIRDQRLVVAGGVDTASEQGLSRRLRGKSAASMAAVACMQGGRVIASVTVGRSDGSAFSADDQSLLESIASLVTLAVTGSVVKREVAEATRDYLTGLYNRAYLDTVFEQIIAWRRRTQPDKRPPLALIVFDIDGFAKINDGHGRLVGDAVLRAVGTLLRQRFRASDVVARVGADSFFVMLNEASVDAASEVAEYIKNQARELNIRTQAGEAVTVSLSAGCARFHDGQKPEELYRSAEAALDAARRAAGSHTPVASAGIAP